MLIKIIEIRTNKFNQYTWRVKQIKKARPKSNSSKQKHTTNFLYVFLTFTVDKKARREKLSKTVNFNFASIILALKVINLDRYSDTLGPDQFLYGAFERKKE